MKYKRIWAIIEGIAIRIMVKAVKTLIKDSN